jgi:hypothetical protein
VITKRRRVNVHAQISEGKTDDKRGQHEHSKKLRGDRGITVYAHGRNWAQNSTHSTRPQEKAGETKRERQGYTRIGRDR